jgi:hypothetical protein
LAGGAPAPPNLLDSPRHETGAPQIGSESRILN